MLEILLAGGWALAPILICSAVALAIVLERCWTLRRKSVLPPGLGDEVRQWARSGQLDPKHIEALASGSPLGELLAAAPAAIALGSATMPSFNPSSSSHEAPRLIGRAKPRPRPRTTTEYAS